MIELSKTGWMSNRGRQNVASYFSKNLLMDWRIGAAYFESQLIDYDVHSNYGNWMYVSGVGNDPRDRKFDVSWQAQKYDSWKVQKLWNQINQTASMIFCFLINYLKSHPYFEKKNDKVLYVQMEFRLFTDYCLHHIQKIIAFS